MVMPGMILSDWVSMVMCSCKHLASRHVLHPPPPGQTSPVLGTCKECKPFSHMTNKGCAGFVPQTMDDAKKMRRAMVLELEEDAEKIVAAPSMAVADQPIPHGTGREIFPLIMADLEERRQYGIRTYGEGLTAFNGRDALQDLYQELLDACVYIRQIIEERDAKAGEIDENEAQARRAESDVYSGIIQDDDAS